MTLLSLLSAELAYGLTPLLDQASCALEEGDRVGLIGRNGTGKSTLLNVFAGRSVLDDGEVQRRDGLRIVTVEQEPELPPADTLFESLRQRGGLEDADDERQRWPGEARLARVALGVGGAGTIDTPLGSCGAWQRAATAPPLQVYP